MAQSGYTPILIYGSGTPGSAPSAGNLTSSASGAELAINYADGKLFYKDSGGVVQVIATKGAGTIGGSNTQVQYNNNGALAGSANLTFNGTTLTAAGLAGPLNGTVGATTPNTGAFTTLTATGGITNTNSGTGISSLNTVVSGTADLLTYSSGGTGDIARLRIRTNDSHWYLQSIQGTANTLDVGIVGTGNIGRFSSTGLAVTGNVSSTGMFTGTATTANGAIVLKAIGRNPQNDSQIAFYQYDGTTSCGFINAQANGVDIYSPNGTKIVGTTNTGLAVTGTLSSTLDATIYGVTVGRGAGAVSTNTVVGASALASNSSSGYITAVGYRAGYGITGENNTAIGRDALYAACSGVSNTAVGSVALNANTSGTLNTGVGFAALLSNTTGSRNTAVGKGALYTNQTGGLNTAVGEGALYNNTAGNNTAVGVNALYYNSTGDGNTAFGRSALSSNSTGSGLVAVGYAALDQNTTGTSNTAVGQSALSQSTTAVSNTAIGYQAGYSNTTGGTNTFLGARTGFNSTTQSEITAVGYEAAFYSVGNYNTYVGRRAGYGQAGGVTTAEYNVSVGGGALYSVTSGSYNTAMGIAAGTAITSGEQNSFIGGYAGSTNTTGSFNSAIGYTSLYLNTTGAYNTALGHVALRSNTTGNYNVAVGRSAMYSANCDFGVGIGFAALSSNAATTGTGNIGIGAYSGQNITSGTYNVGVGYQSLASLQTSSYNVAVGYNAGFSVTSGADNTFVGRQAGAYNISTTTGSYNVVVGSLARCAAIGNSYEIVIGYNTEGKGSSTGFINPNGGGVYQGNNSSSWSTTSDGRIKTNKQRITNGLDIICALEPTEFDYIVTGKRDVGFIAQEYMLTLPEQVHKHAASPEEKELVGEDEIYGINPNLVPYLVSAIKQLRAEIAKLKGAA